MLMDIYATGCKTTMATTERRFRPPAVYVAGEIETTNINYRLVKHCVSSNYNIVV